MLSRALRLGSAVFMVLVGMGAIGLAGVFWHHQTIANQSSRASAEQAHTEVIFVFASSPFTLVAAAAIIWILCVGISYLWLTSHS